ncbi:KH domain-containing protein HEN4 isoform X2 [Mangifera indica]|uniref:KH domain-containing protein HEN4 isoform X2 n=1 Tax=Mangifera indica TaxID=29780 RepID=UPI001CF933FC|nr:KH domain-containing protein HEN4 isoform X2 [Mangifera indica]
MLMKRTIMSDPNPYSTANGSSNKRSKPPPPPLTVPQGHVAFRLLCHASRIGGVIGKSGNVIKQLQNSTGVKIRIEEAPSDSPDRVVTVIGPTNVDTRMSVSGSRNSGSFVDRNGNEGNGDDRGEKDGSCFEVSKAQEGLIRVFERILEVAAETDGIEIGVVSCRLLAETHQVGSIIGKGGKVVEKIRRETGCKIRVLTENLSACAGPNDEIVEIDGDVLAVKKALIAVSRRLQDCPPVDKTRMIGSKSHEAAPLESLHRPLEVVPQETMRRPIEAIPHDIIRRPLEAVPQENVRRPLEAFASETSRRSFEAVPLETLRRPFEAVPQDTLPDLRIDLLSQRNSLSSTIPSSSISYAPGIHPVSLEADRISTLDTKMQQQEVSFRILCSNDKVGGVIGKGGNIVKALQNEAGASITVGSTVADCDERLITVTALENPESRYSSAQKAVVLVFSRLIGAGFEKGPDLSSNKGFSVIARLVVASNQVGCLLGKGGTIISEMRKATGTGIRIIGDQVPKCTSENDKVVQISGEFLKVIDAVYNVTGRLRDNLFSSSLNNAGTRNTSSVLADTSPYGRLREAAAVGLPSSVGVSHSGNRHPILTQSMDHIGFSHSLDRPSSPRLWASQAVTGAYPWAITDLSRGRAHLKGGLELGSGNRTAIVTNTTVEIIVPENVISSVYGENGSNLARLKQVQLIGLL